jgi:hypothetical protein
MKKTMCAGFVVPALRPPVTTAAFRPLSHVSATKAYAVLMSAISAIGISVASVPERALAQSDTPALEDMHFDNMSPWPGAGTSTTNSPLPPSDIIADVRREGFYPVSRPVHRGRVYVLFAVDEDDMDVKLTVDAASGRVLWAAGAVAHLGGPGRYGYRSHWRADHPLASPAAGDEDDNGASPARSDARRARARRNAQKRFPPVTHTPRPADLDGAGSPLAHGESQEPPEVLPPITPLE